MYGQEEVSEKKEAIFKAKTSVDGGMVLQTMDIGSKFRTFKGDELLEACKAFPEIDIEIFDGENFVPFVRNSPASTVSSGDTSTKAVEDMSRAELKQFLVEKGVTEDLSSYDKQTLVDMAKVYQG